MIDDTSNNLGLVLQKITAEPDLLPEIRENEVHLWCLPLKLDAGQHKNALKLLTDHQKVTPIPSSMKILPLGFMLLA